ncbi:hypothetical protein B0J11DRAFT_504793 [Dendryphion nanum]|uniref:Uncharacterized protein n=1 Tax=Dendryphion nanum TaxID=256645 RepID=A0A9P9IRB3_9PLEO|nr:hypothetical protein B0J11DRAFT_504793 [Dendryphion nanum]
MISQFTPVSFNYNVQRLATDYLARQLIADANVAREEAKYRNRNAPRANKGIFQPSGLKTQKPLRVNQQSSQLLGCINSSGLPSPSIGCPSNPVRTRNFKRSVTPVQLDTPVHATATGPDPQADRPLLIDFFSDIQTWAENWASPVYKCDGAGVVTAQTLFSDSASCMGVLDNKENRAQIIAGIVAYRITLYTLSEASLIHSCHSEANVSVKPLLDVLNSLGAGEVNKKESMLALQKELYTTIQTGERYYQWREAKSAELAEITVQKLEGLVISDTKQGQALKQTLTQLFLRGFRIGFRMRMEVADWRFEWICPGATFDLGKMVNTARRLHGDSITATVNRIQLAPTNYSVRWSLSPVITKTTISSGMQHLEMVHSAMVNLRQVKNYIGAEFEARRAFSKHATVFGST